MQAHDPMGIGEAEVTGCFVEETGVYRCTAKSDQHQPREAPFVVLDKQQDQYARQDDSLAQADHIQIANPVGHETGQESSGGDAQVEQGCPLGGNYGM